MVETSAVLASAEDRMVDEAVAVLEPRQHGYDEASSAAERRRYVRHLFGLVIQCVHEGQAEPVIASSRQVAADRFGAGLDIAETGRAFNVLEEVLWHEVAGALAGEQRVEALGQVHAILGAGKDALVRTYVALAGGEGGALGEQPAPRRGAAEAAAPAGTDGLAGGAVRTQVAGAGGVIILDDQPRRNAISAQMANGIVAALESLRADGVRAAVLRAAAGQRVWSAGHDIGELPRGRRDPLAYNDPLGQMLRAIRSFPAPVVAMVHGSVWGGALDLVLSCDLVVADETATFAITAANLGLPYNTTGLLHFVGRLPGNVIKEMFFTAAPIDARQAKQWLLVNHLVGSAELARAGHDDGDEVADGHSGHQGTAPCP